MTGVSLQVSGPRATLRLGREPLNVLDIPMLEVIAEKLDGLDSGSTSVLLVESELERTFSAGVDVADHREDRASRMLEVVHGVVRRLERAPYATVAVVDGPALGGGCELALSCDFVLATERAVFALPEIRLGVYPPVAVAQFSELVGRRRAEQMILTGDPIPAVEAARIGLITDVVDSSELELRTEALVSTLLRHSRSSLRETKEALRLARRADPGAALDAVERHYLESLMNTADAREGLDAFLEKRPPAWSHR